MIESATVKCPAKFVGVCVPRNCGETGKLIPQRFDLLGLHPRVGNEASLEFCVDRGTHQMRPSWIEWFLLGDAEIWGGYPDLVEDVRLDMGVSRLAIRTQVEVGTICAMPPDATNGSAVAAVAGNAPMNHTLMSGAILSYMVQGSLKRLTLGIAYHVVFPVASLGGG